MRGHVKLAEEVAHLLQRPGFCAGKAAELRDGVLDLGEQGGEHDGAQVEGEDDEESLRRVHG